MTAASKLLIDYRARKKATRIKTDLSPKICEANDFEGKIRFSFRMMEKIEFDL